MLAQVDSSAILGIDAYVVRVEVDISSAVPMFTIVGLPDAAVQESRERVRSAIRNTGLEFPLRRITINLAPADVKKQGPAFDLPIAVGLLAATGQIRDDRLAEGLFVGELALDGAVSPVSGVLPIAIKAKADKRAFLVVPEANAREAAIVGDVKVYPVKTLADVVTLLADMDAASPLTADPESLLRTSPWPTGWTSARSRARSTSNAPWKSPQQADIIFVLVGPPGSGKTMLARRVPSVLPPLSLDEALDVTKIYSVGGLLGTNTALVTQRPFRSPHHSISNAALAGGGSTPRPGEVSLSHHGVLFLDELPEFRRDVLEVLRQPLEDGHVTIARIAATMTYPARIMLVAAMNPCPCGYFGDSVKVCTCSPPMIQKYLQRISGPLLDRIDIHIEVPRLRQEEMIHGGGTGEPSAAIQAARGRGASSGRRRALTGTALHCNARMGARQLKAVLPGGRGREGPAARRHRAVGPVRPRLRPHPQAGPDRRRPGGRRGRYRKSPMSPRPSSTAPSTASSGDEQFTSPASRWYNQTRSMLKGVTSCRLKPKPPPTKKLSRISQPGRAIYDDPAQSRFGAGL